jgi:hypothetical protein
MVEATRETGDKKNTERREGTAFGKGNKVQTARRGDSGLMDSKYGIKRFKKLYFKRWPIETEYAEVKNKLEVESFSGILVENIRQDFYAAMTLANIAGDLYKEAQEEVEEERKGHMR